MGLHYFVTTTLNTEYTQKNINSLIIRADSFGFVYYDQFFVIGHEEPRIVDIKEAVHKIIYAYKNNLDEGPCVYAKFEDNYMHLWFEKSKKNNFLEVTLSVSTFWERDFEGHEFKDLYRYLRLLLELCNNYSIINLYTYKV